MTKIKLGVNIDHVATIRNARGEAYPDPIKAALLAQESGADSITIHLREDRRHIKDKDLKKICKTKIPLNFFLIPPLYWDYPSPHLEGMIAGLGGQLIRGFTCFVYFRLFA